MPDYQGTYIQWVKCFFLHIHNLNMRISEYDFYWCAKKIKWEDARENISFKHWEMEYHSGTSWDLFLKLYLLFVW